MSLYWTEVDAASYGCLSPDCRIASPSMKFQALRFRVLLQRHGLWLDADLCEILEHYPPCKRRHFAATNLDLLDDSYSKR